ncbi:Uncharacterised protein [Chlamydia abortus]|uniref:Uncharacterized protein n=1 Tax=Paenibacillus residui TaxID=629724 RepID=A0ABW3DCR5_9BACL|nr:Uncharacterised protein [Chlamydia abortus]
MFRRKLGLRVNESLRTLEAIDLVNWKKNARNRAKRAPVELNEEWLIPSEEIRDKGNRKAGRQEGRTAKSGVIRMARKERDVYSYDRAVAPAKTGGDWNEQTYRRIRDTELPQRASTPNDLYHLIHDHLDHIQEMTVGVEQLMKASAELVRQLERTFGRE